MNCPKCGSQAYYLMNAKSFQYACWNQKCAWRSEEIARGDLND